MPAVVPLMGDADIIVCLPHLLALCTLSSSHRSDRAPRRTPAMPLRRYRSIRHQSLVTMRVTPGQLVEVDPDDPAWARWLEGDHPSLIPADDEGESEPEPFVAAHTYEVPDYRTLTSSEGDSATIPPT